MFMDSCIYSKEKNIIHCKSIKLITQTEIMQSNTITGLGLVWQKSTWTITIDKFIFLCFIIRIFQLYKLICNFEHWKKA